MKTPRILEPICDKWGRISSMRIVIFVFTFVCAGLIDALCDYIRAFAKKGLQVDWMGMAAFIGALTTIMGILVFQKVRQTRIENESEK